MINTIICSFNDNYTDYCLEIIDLRLKIKEMTYFLLGYDIHTKKSFGNIFEDTGINAKQYAST